MLFSWGANSQGQLGLGHRNDVSEPRIVAQRFDKLGLIVCGGRHSMILANGRLLSCGSNEKGQLAICESGLDQFRINALDYVIGVACGWDYTVALCINGVVYSWGSNSYGQLGVDDDVSKKPVEIKELNGRKVVRVAAGLRHAAAVSDSGEIFVWGDNSKQQCISHSKVNKKCLRTPIKIITDLKFKEVYCGANHTLALTEDGSVYGWGSNSKGQLAHDPVKHPILNLTKIDLPPIKSIATGWSHVLAITDGGKVLSWGRCDYGQLGRSIQTEKRYDYLPANIATDGEPLQISCGSEHSMLLKKDGVLMTWGWNEHGMCGNGTTDNVKLPTEVKIKSGKNNVLVAVIGSGAGHCFAYSENFAILELGISK